MKDRMMRTLADSPQRGKGAEAAETSGGSGIYLRKHRGCHVAGDRLGVHDQTCGAGTLALEIILDLFLRILDGVLDVFAGVLQVFVGARPRMTRKS
ncbi:hypothetical protein AYO49_05785 [Verrucomicrobiaceae bacterium SCGC AG-212-N21]|nr:hypothetical protein AYO49_05785 [Verrucomicrobiaceae bacterium SCGC AG-212-N21]